MKLSICHSERKHYAKGLCKSCYARSPERRATLSKYLKSDNKKMARQKYNHSEKGKAKRKAYNEKYYGSPEHREYYKIYRKNPKLKQYQLNYQFDRMKSDPEYKLRKTLRSRISRLLRDKPKTGSAIKDLGCSVLELKFYLEVKFQLGMTWENHGKWHIDHVKPLASFDLTDPEQFKEACHFTNLQPLWAEANLSKGAKYAKT